MPEEPPHPLSRIRSIDALLALPYFEILACLTSGSLHPGGGAATQLLLDLVGLRPNEHVLEIGCGPGWTTRALIRAGIAVSVVEKSPLMVSAMLYHCGAENLPYPPVIQADISDVEPTRFNHSFDLILLECVTGFVGDRRRLAKVVESSRSLRGRIAALDVHYRTDPPAALTRELRRVTGADLPVLKREDWLGLFPDTRCARFETFSLPSTTTDNAARIVEEARLDRWLALKPADSLKLSRYLDDVATIFAENKRYLDGHIAVYRSDTDAAHVANKESRTF